MSKNTGKLGIFDNTLSFMERNTFEYQLIIDLINLLLVSTSWMYAVNKLRSIQPAVHILVRTSWEHAFILLVFVRVSGLGHAII